MWKTIIDSLDLSEIRPSRLQDLINVMQRVKDREGRLIFSHWQSVADWRDTRKETEKELHACGMPACIGGWLAVSNEFRGLGGWVASNGAPMLPTWCEEDDLDTECDALQAFLIGKGIKRALKYATGQVSHYLANILPEGTHGLYNPEIEITPDDVLDRLKYIQTSLPTGSKN